MTGARIATGVLAATLAVLAVGCSGGSTSTPTAPTPPVSTPNPSPSPAPAPPPVTLSATITITAGNKFDPPEARVLVGGRVTFINQNNRAYDITSDPLHLHTDCPALMDVGFIVPGQTKVSGPLTTARTCGYHDHMQETNPDVHGSIIIQGTSE